MIFSKLKSLSSHRILFSVLFSVINLFIFYIQHDDVHYLVFVANMPILTAIVYFLTGKLLQYCHKKNHIYSDIAENISAKQYFWRVSLILFVSWLPIFLAYYPGIFSYDVQYQIPQANTGYLNWQPLTHTLLIQFFYYIIGGKLFCNYNVGIAIATVFQMGLFAMMLSFLHLYLYKCRLKKSIRYVLIGLTAILPQFSMLAISVTKDTLFSGFCVVFLTTLLFEENFANNQYRKMLTVVSILSGIAVVLFRSNGIFPMIAILLYSLYKFIFQRKKQLLLHMIIIVLTAVVMQNLLTVVLSAEKNPKNEMLSVPYQQIAGVYYDNYNSLTDEEKKYIEYLFPTLERYQPKISDSIKNFSKGQKDMKTLISFYFKLGIKYPYTYIKSFCHLNAGYLSVTDITYSEIYGKSMRQGVLLSDTKEGFDIDHYSLLPIVEDSYELLYTDNQYIHIIGLNLLLSPAFYFWITVLLFIEAFVCQKKKTLPLILFSGTLILTILFGPCSLVRYALAFEVCLPLLFVTVFNKTEE